MNVSCNYCWWKKSCTSWYGKYPIIYKVLYMPGGAGFLPSTVSQMYWEFSCSATFCCQEAAYQAETSEWAGNTTLAFSTVAAPSWSVGTLPQKKNTPRNKHREEPIPKNAKKTMWCVCHPVFEFFQILVEEELRRANARLKVHVLTKIGMRCVSPLLAFYKGVSPATWLNATTKNCSWLARTSGK